MRQKPTYLEANAWSLHAFFAALVRLRHLAALAAPAARAALAALAGAGAAQPALAPLTAGGRAAEGMPARAAMRSTMSVWAMKRKLFVML